MAGNLNLFTSHSHRQRIGFSQKGKAVFFAIDSCQSLQQLFSGSTFMNSSCNQQKTTKAINISTSVKILLPLLFIYDPQIKIPLVCAKTPLIHLILKVSSQFTYQTLPHPKNSSTFS